MLGSKGWVLLLSRVRGRGPEAEPVQRYCIWKWHRIPNPCFSQLALKSHIEIHNQTGESNEGHYGFSVKH
jgi:hypothetical protein